MGAGDIGGGCGEAMHAPHVRRQLAKMAGCGHKPLSRYHVHQLFSNVFTHAGGLGGGCGGFGGDGDGGGGCGGSGGGEGGPRQMETSAMYIVRHVAPGTSTTVMKLVFLPGIGAGVGAVAPTQSTTKGPAVAGAVMTPPLRLSPHLMAPAPMSPKKEPSHTWNAPMLAWYCVKAVLCTTM